MGKRLPTLPSRTIFTVGLGRLSGRILPSSRAGGNQRGSKKTIALRQNLLKSGDFKVPCQSSKYAGFVGDGLLGSKNSSGERNQSPGGARTNQDIK
jgi:hypothetical protein